MKLAHRKLTNLKDGLMGAYCLLTFKFPGFYNGTILVEVGEK